MCFNLYSFFFFIPNPSHQSGGGMPSINGRVVIVGPTVQENGPFGNKRKSCLINGGIDLRLAVMAERWSISHLIYKHDMRAPMTEWDKDSVGVERRIWIKSTKFFFFPLRWRNCWQSSALDKPRPLQLFQSLLVLLIYHQCFVFIFFVQPQIWFQ